MSRPTENNEQEVREGTEALKSIAEDVEAEREQASGKTSLPSDEAEEAAEPLLEDRETSDGVLPEHMDTTPVHPPVRPNI